MASPKHTVSLTLMELPGEVRNRIYRFSVVSSGPILVQTLADTIVSKSKAKKKAKGKQTRSFLNFPPAVLVVSRQLRSEVSPIFYEENRFTLWASTLTRSAVQTFERLCGASAMRMTALNTSMSGEYFPPLKIQVAADGTSIEVECDEVDLDVNITPLGCLFTDTCGCLFQKLATNYNKALASGDKHCLNILFGFLKEVEYFTWRFAGPRPIIQ